MRLFVTIVLMAVAVSARPKPQGHQGQVDPAYLRQYYQSLQAGGHQRQAAPIYEGQAEAAPPRFAAAASPAPQQVRILGF